MEDIKIYIYTKPSCFKCKNLMKRMDRELIQYEVVKDKLDEAIMLAAPIGIQALPVVKVLDKDGEHIFNDALFKDYMTLKQGIII